MYSESNNNKLSNCTIGEVAKLAKVSPMSVTRTYSSPDKVSERIKKKVIAAAKELGYRPNILARSLRSGKSMTVGIVWSLCGPHDSGMVVREMAKKLFDHGYVSFISDSYSDSRIIKESLHNFAARKVDGLILHADMQYIMEDAELINILRNIPHVVIVGRRFFNSPFDEIKRDLLPPIKQIIDHWVSHGRKNIYYLTPKHLKERTNFFEKCLKAYGLEYSNHIIDSHYFEDDSIGCCFQKAFKNYFRESISCDAVLCSCDEGAAGIMDYLTQKGLGVPENVAVCGWNNSQISAYFNPHMASVDREAMETAQLAVRTLLARLKGDSSSPKRLETQMKLILRKSAG